MGFLWTCMGFDGILAEVYGMLMGFVHDLLMEFLVNDPNQVAIHDYLPCLIAKGYIIGW